MKDTLKINVAPDIDLFVEEFGSGDRYIKTEESTSGVKPHSFCSSFYLRKL